MSNIPSKNVTHAVKRYTMHTDFYGNHVVRTWENSGESYDKVGDEEYIFATDYDGSLLEIERLYAALERIDAHLEVRPGDPLGTAITSSTGLSYQTSGKRSHVTVLVVYNISNGLLWARKRSRSHCFMDRGDYSDHDDTVTLDTMPPLVLDPVATMVLTLGRSMLVQNAVRFGTVVSLLLLGIHVLTAHRKSHDC